MPEQFLIILRKFFTLYNRMPEYNAGQCRACTSKTCNHHLAARVCLPDFGLWSQEYVDSGTLALHSVIKINAVEMKGLLTVHRN